MGQIITSVLTSAGVSAALFAALTWLSKTWISERLKNAIKYEYDQKMEIYRGVLKADFDREIETLRYKLKSESDKELEILKAKLKSQTDLAAEHLRSELQITASERQIRFAKLYEDVAETIAETYARLQRLYDAVASYTEVIEFADDTPKAERKKVVSEMVDSFSDYYKPRRIFIPKPTSKKIDEFESKLFNVAQDFMWYVEQGGDPSHRDSSTRAKVLKQMLEDVPPLFDLLEQDFRDLLGFQSTIGNISA